MTEGVRERAVEGGIDGWLLEVADEEGGAVVFGEGDAGAGGEGVVADGFAVGETVYVDRHGAAGFEFGAVVEDA